MNERILGYLLLASGIILMALSVCFVYLAFTNQIKPFTVFKETAGNNPNKASDMQDFIDNPANIAQLQKEIVTEIIEKQINKSMNMGATIFMMYFLMLFGFRISTLGVQLVRPINVKLSSLDKNNDTTTH